MGSDTVWQRRKRHAEHSLIREMPCKVGLATGTVLCLVSIGLAIADFYRNGISVTTAFFAIQFFFWLSVVAFSAFLLERCRCNELLRSLPENSLPQDNTANIVEKNQKTLP